MNGLRWITLLKANRMVAAAKSPDRREERVTVLNARETADLLSLLLTYREALARVVEIVPQCVKCPDGECPRCVAHKALRKE